MVAAWWSRKSRNGHGVPLAGFAEPSADGLVDEVVVVCERDTGHHLCSAGPPGLNFTATGDDNTRQATFINEVT